MRRTRLLAAAVLLAAALPASLSAISRADFDEVVDFAVTIKSLHRLSETNARAYGLDEHLLLLSGTVSALTVIDPQEQSYLVEVELLSGEWLGLEEVASYRCRVQFRGPEFARLIPPRRPRDPDPRVIGNDDNVLVVARLLRPVNGQDGQPLWLLEGYYARRLP